MLFTKFKKILKFGIPAIFAIRLAATLPLTLTAYSDSEEDKKFEITQDENQDQVVDADDFEPINFEVKASGNDVKYQWYYRDMMNDKPSDESLISLSNSNEADGVTSEGEEIDLDKDGWKELKGATKPKLEIAPEFIYNGSAVNKDYVCKITEKDNSQPIFSNIKTVETSNDFVHAKVVPTTSTTIKQLQSSDEFIGQVITSADIDNNCILTNETIQTSLAEALGLSSSRYDRSALSKVYKEIKLSNKSISDDATTTSYNVEVTLLTDQENVANSNTWSSDVYLNKDNDIYTVNDKNVLIIKGVKFGVDKSDPDLQPVTVNNFVTVQSKFNELITSNEIKNQYFSDGSLDASKNSDFLTKVIGLTVDDVKEISSVQLSNSDTENTKITQKKQKLDLTLTTTNKNGFEVQKELTNGDNIEISSDKRQSHINH